MIDDNRPLLVRDEELQAQRQKRRVRIGAIIGVVLLAVVIILILVLKKSDDNGPNPPPDDTNPLDFQEYNPFLISNQDYSANVWYVNGVLGVNLTEPNNYKRLQHVGDGTIKYKTVEPQDVPIGVNNPPATNVAFNFSLINNYQARVQIGAVGGNNFSVPNETSPRNVEEFEARFTMMGMNMSKKNEPFWFSFTNIFNGQEVMTTKNRKFVVQEKFSEIGMVLPNKRVFGLGTSNRQLQLKTDSTYTLFSKGMQNESMPLDQGLGGTHGPQVHPFILGQTSGDKKDFYGIFFMGGGAQSFELVAVEGTDQVILNYITLSDQIEIFIIQRGSAQDIIKRFQHDIGYPSMPSYFALGIFAGSQSENWANSTAVMNDLNNMITAKLPIEGILLDNYTKDGLQPFTIDTLEGGFGSVSTVHAFLRDNGMHLFLGIQSAMPSDSDYYPWLSLAINDYQCLLNDTFHTTSENYNVGFFTPFGDKGITSIAQVDVFSPGARDFLQRSIATLANLTNGFDGLYLRGNTPFTNSNGSDILLARKQKPIVGSPPDPENQGDYTGYKFGGNQTHRSYQDIPFTPGFENGGGLDTHTINMALIHSGFAHYENPHPAGVPEFYVHNLNGLRHHQVVFDILRYNQTSRPNVFSESTWPGTGLIGGSWQQPLALEWASLRSVIAQAMNMALSGVNSWVVEVCGMENSRVLEGEDLELCTRWMELAAFLPMVRIQGPLVSSISSPAFSNFQKAMNQRLPFTRYIYSQMFAANYTGGTVTYPLFFDSPDDDETFNNVESTYMLGDSLKISPVLDSDSISNSTVFESYFPQGVWRDIFNYSNVIDASAGGAYFNLTRKAGETQVHLRPGKVLPIQPQQAGFDEQQRTSQLERQKVTLVVNRDDSNYADGYILVDDGIRSDNFASDEYTFWKVRVGEKSINFWVERGNFLYDVHKHGFLIDQLDEIRILGAKSLNDTDYACYLGTTLQPEKMDASYDEKLEVLTIKPAATTANLTFREIGFIKFGNSATDPNVCDAKGFSYNATELTDLGNDTFRAFELVPALGGDVLETLYATALLMDDDGSVNLNITTKSDWDSNFTKLFRVPYVSSMANYPHLQVTKKLNDFMSFDVGTDVPFSYKLFEFQDPTKELFRSDPNKLFLTKFLVFDSGIFNMNQANDNPLMGMGERAGDLYFKNETGGIHSRWAHDAANPIDDGLPPGRNMYGSQPMYIYQSDTLKWFMVFNSNPYATDFIVSTNNGVNANITTVTIGGLIEKYFFRGAKPDDVIVKYTNLTGNPTMPPMWAFGWQQCRFGWVTDHVWEFIVQQYEDFKIPIDTMWADIDYLDDYRIFTIAQESYGRLPQLVHNIRQKNMTFVPIMDVGVPVRLNEGYVALERGLEDDIFIKQSTGVEPLTAGVWGNNAYFPDFFHPNATSYWFDMWDYLLNHYGLEIDGIWIDMNEASTHCDGYCIPDERPKLSLRNLAYYIPGQRDLEALSIGVDGLHYNGFHEYDAHNTFCLLQIKATADYLIQQGKRPYVLSRGNYPGLQKYGYHWIGDNWSWVEYMIASVKNVYEYQLFGLPFMGSDLCGFNGNAKGDLCTRWHQLGTLFPFSRNHNQNATTPQEPFRFNYTFREGDNTTYTDLIRIAIQNRYTYIRYYYSQFWSITEFGGTFFKPLFFEFPEDPNSYNDIERNILLGNNLKASVETTRLTDGTTDFYFPLGTWCQLLPTLALNFSEGCFTSDGTLQNGNRTMRTHMEDYYVHQRNGSVVPLQNASFHDTMNTKQQLWQRTDLSILPNKENQPVPNLGDCAASGFLYFDDGVSYEKNTTRHDIFFLYDAQNPTKVASLVFQQAPGSTYIGGTPNEQVGTISIFNPFMDPSGSARKIQVATVTIKGKQDPIDITNQVYYEGTYLNQVIFIDMRDMSKTETGDHFRFNEIDKVTIQYP